jgi:hypothetical protein
MVRISLLIALSSSLHEFLTGVSCDYLYLLSKKATTPKKTLQDFFGASRSPGKESSKKPGTIFAVFLSSPSPPRYITRIHHRDQK